MPDKKSNFSTPNRKAQAVVLAQIQLCSGLFLKYTNNRVLPSIFTAELN